MDSVPQSKRVIQSLRPGDLVGHRQRPERQYEELIGWAAFAGGAVAWAGTAVYCVGGCGGAVLGVGVAIATFVAYGRYAELSR